MSVPPSGGGVKNGHPKNKIQKVPIESSGSDASGGKPSTPKPTPAPAATSNRPPRLPREPFTVNTLTVDEDEDQPPDFVGSKYQRVVDDDRQGTFAHDWVALVTGTNKAEYLVLARIASWFAQSKSGKPFVTEFWNDHWWLYKFCRGLAADVRTLTIDEVRWAVRSLTKKGILIADYDPSRQKPKLYRIDPVVVAELEEAAERRIAEAMRKGRDIDRDED